MIAFTAVFVIASFGFLVHHFAPRGADRTDCLERFHPRAPIAEAPLSYYDDQRRYADLLALRCRDDRIG